VFNFDNLLHIVSKVKMSKSLYRGPHTTKNNQFSKRRWLISHAFLIKKLLGVPMWTGHAILKIKSPVNKGYFFSLEN